MTVGTLRSMHTPVAPVITNPESWIEQAACAPVGPGPWDTTGDTLTPANRRALGICRTCPVLAECREFADRLESQRRQNVECIFGGETPAQRSARRQKTTRVCQDCGRHLLKRSKHPTIRESGLCSRCFKRTHPAAYSRLAVAA